MRPARLCRPFSSLLAFAALANAGGAAAAPDGGEPIALVVETAPGAPGATLPPERLREALSAALAATVTAGDRAAAAGAGRRLFVAWRPAAGELSVTYEERRSTLGRTVPVRDAEDAVRAAVALAVNLVRDQTSELLTAPEASATPPATSPPATAAAPTPSPPVAPPVLSAPAPRAPEPRRPRVYLALAAGTGYGWFTGTGDVNADSRAGSGLASGWAQLGHLAPEVGLVAGPHLVLSAQARLQLVTGTTVEPDPTGTTCGADHLCAPPSSAVAGFLRATAVAGAPDAGWRPTLSFAVGAGTIRHVAALPQFRDCGAGANETCVDTFSAGSLLFGPAVGVRRALGGGFLLVGAVEAQLAAPRFTVNFDVNVGVAVAL